jgi:hypothetical protein
MSQALVLLNMLAESGPLTVRQMAQRAGYTIAQTHDALQSLRKRKAASAMDTPYQMTKEGAEWLQSHTARLARLEKQRAEAKAAVAARKAELERSGRLVPGVRPMTAEQREAIRVARLDRRREKRQLDRLTASGRQEVEDADLQLVQKIVAAPLADPMISGIAQRQPALQAAWGVMHV